MKKLLLLLLSASAALTVMAGLLPSTSLCQLLSEREEALDDVLLPNSSANLLPVLDMTRIIMVVVASAPQTTLPVILNQRVM